MQKYNVQLVIEYPIYEMAEGGYYYAGRNVYSCKAKTRKQAQQILKEWAEYEGIPLITADYALERSSYIGEDRYIIITKKHKKIKSRGSVPYE